MAQRNIVEVQDLEIKFYTYAGIVEALDGVNLFIREGEILGLVGETGCGKSVTSLSIMMLVPPPGKIEGGRIVFSGASGQQSILTMDDDSLRRMRGKDISMIFQEPRAYLNPVYTVENQISESMLVHREDELLKNCIASIEMKLADKRKAKLEKHKASLEKRMTVLEKQKDTEKQRTKLQKQRTKVENQISDVMSHPPSNLEISTYRRMLKAAQFWNVERGRQFEKKKAKLEKRRVELERRKGTVKQQAKINRLKTEVERQYAELTQKGPQSFVISRRRRIVRTPSVWALRFPARFSRKRQLRQQIRKEVVSVLKSVEIPDPERVAEMYPHELSGGMAQRVVIAMALACNPTMLIADEPTTNLDVTVQAQILNLIKVLKKNMGSSILYITHDLGVVAQSCDRVAVMYAGNVVETADVFETFSAPLHPYTIALLESIPRPGEPFKSIPGIVPSLINPLRGCRFHDRCSYAMEICPKVKPPFREVKSGHYVSCHLYYGGSK